MWARGQVQPTQCRLFSGDELTLQEDAAVGVWNNRAPRLREREILFFGFVFGSVLARVSAVETSQGNKIHLFKAVLSGLSLVF